MDIAAPNPPPPPLRALHIVGIGASAGGLAPIEQFLQNVPVDSGLAYIVVQHLDPTQKAVLGQLLQKITPLPVQEVTSALVIEPNHVYVIPPNKELSIAEGHLILRPPSEPRGLRLPINVLFSSMAQSLGSQAIGVVLSGMGSDGTQGLRAIQAVGGLTLVQAPTSAQFDAMPTSAIAAQCVDIVAQPHEMPSRIAHTLDQQTAQMHSQPNEATSAGQHAALPTIIGLIQQCTRHDFSLYKPSTVTRRVERRMAIHGLGSLKAYADFLSQNPQEIDLLFKELLIGVTSFFRDPAVWQHLRDTTLPDLLNRRGAQTQFRAWVIGCSTGEEAYSLAMAFAEVRQRMPQHADCCLQIFASDLSPDAIATARTARYPQSVADTLEPDQIKAFFTQQDGALTINKTIRDMVLFAQHDVVLDPPFTKLDILCCRNVLIYFDAALQKRLLPLFHYSLKPGGVMLLGSSETAGPFSTLFEPLEPKLRLYQRKEQNKGVRSQFVLRSFPPLSSSSKDITVPSLPSPAPFADSLQTAADRVLLQVHAPPAVVVNHLGDIVYISGRTGKYLEPAAGKANWNFHAMVRDALRQPIAEALKQAVEQGETIHLHGLQIAGVDAKAPPTHVDVTVQALQEPAALRDMTMIVFKEQVQPTGRRRRSHSGEADAAYAAELQRYKHEVQALREEARTTKEDLQSANEELQSTNEELQSTNEELTTSKEEMQSMNEELQTVNAEMQAKLDDLALAQSDMKSLLNSTDIAMLFLDQDLNVRRYTDRTTKIINLRESDIGRPLSDLTTTLDYPDLHSDAQHTLQTLVFSEKQIQTHDHRWFSIRIMPYRRLDNVIDGAVITFVDITATKQLEAQLRTPHA